MFQEGKVKTYNEERGFGFIQIEGEKKDLFFHIKDFPNKNVQPEIGERLKFRIVDDNGKLKADNIVRIDFKTQAPTFNNQGNQSKYKNSSAKKQIQLDTKSGFGFSSIIGLVVFVILAYLLYSKYQRWQLQQQPHVSEAQQIVYEHANTNPNGYRCDGRIHCSQMNSREEARWFVRNCPGTKMDGNNDGEPCESDSRW
jgi:cold shock CspA family protein